MSNPKSYDKNRVYKVTLYPNSSTTEIMDEFTKREEDGNIVYDIMRLSMRNHGILIGNEYCDVEFIIGHGYVAHMEQGYNNGITLTEIKKGKLWTFLFYLKKLFPTPDELWKNINLYKDYYFETPFLFRAQCSYQRGKGSTLGGTIQYGSTNDFPLLGIEISPPYIFGGKKSFIIMYSAE